MSNLQEQIERDARLLAEGASQPVRSAIEDVVSASKSVATEDQKKPSLLLNPIVAAVLFVLAYLPVAFYLNANYTALDTTIMNPPFEHIAGNSYVTYHFIRGRPDGPTLTLSTIELYEDGKKLGPAHSAHSLITTEGRGRFSHWAVGDENRPNGSMIIFSTSDNTNPNTNGRTYRAINP